MLIERYRTNSEATNFTRFTKEVLETTGNWVSPSTNIITEVVRRISPVYKQINTPSMPYNTNINNPMILNVTTYIHIILRLYNVSEKCLCM